VSAKRAVAAPLYLKRRADHRPVVADQQSRLFDMVWLASALSLGQGRRLL